MEELTERWRWVRHCRSSGGTDICIQEPRGCACKTALGRWGASALAADLLRSGPAAVGQHQPAQAACLSVSDGWVPASPVSGGETQRADAQSDGTPVALLHREPSGETARMAPWGPTATVEMKRSVRRPQRPSVDAARRVIDGRRAILSSQRSGWDRSPAPVPPVRGSDVARGPGSRPLAPRPRAGVSFPPASFPPTAR